MKFFATFLILGSLFLAGCSTVERGLFRQESYTVRNAQTNAVEVVADQIPVAVEEAKAIGAFVVATNYTGTNAHLITVLPERRAIRYVPRESTQTVIREGSKFAPLPGAGIIGMALSSILSLVAGWKTAAARGDKIAGKMAVSMDEYRNTVLNELEKFNQNDSNTIDPGSFDAKALKALKVSQRAAGYGEQIARIVHKFTGHTSNR